MNNFKKQKRRFSKHCHYFAKPRRVDFAFERMFYGTPITTEPRR